MSHKTCEEVNFIVLCCRLNRCALIFFNTEYDKGPFPEMQTPNKADSIIHNLWYGKKRLHSFRKTIVIFYHKHAFRIMLVLKTLRNNIANLESVQCFNKGKKSIGSMIVLKTM